MDTFQAEIANSWDGAYAVAMRILANRESARDAAQEASCLALRHAGRFDRRRSVRPWFLTIARNVALGEVRRRARFADATEVPDPGHIDAGIEHVETRETCDAVLRELPKLRPAYRSALKLKCRGYGYREIALALNIPIGTAQTHVHRAQRELRSRCLL
jgi:RNA polymerase sigma-70 factor (ECF subfamily)